MSKWELPAKGGHMEAQDGVYFQNMTTVMVEERLKKNDVILIPVGSTENHGPSAPYGEDTYLDTRLCELVAKKTGCTVAQPIWYGSHPYHHLGQKGTIMIPEKILADYLAYVLQDSGTPVSVNDSSKWHGRIMLFHWRSIPLARSGKFRDNTLCPFLECRGRGNFHEG